VLAGSLPLLEKRCSRRKRFCGFVSGQWLKIINYVIAKYQSIYGKASVGAPPMSVPHYIKNDQWRKSSYLSICWFSTRFLKMDPIQICLYPKPDNIISDVVSRNKKYTVDQVFDTASTSITKDRIDALKEYVPSAKLLIIKERVNAQVIKKDKKEGGILAFIPR
jgi:malate dehydrogenase (quinone)